MDGRRQTDRHSGSQFRLGVAHRIPFDQGLDSRNRRLGDDDHHPAPGSGMHLSRRRHPAAQRVLRGAQILSAQQ